MDGYYDKLIQQNTDNTTQLTELLKSFNSDDDTTNTNSSATGDTRGDGTGKVDTSTDTSGGEPNLQLLNLSLPSKLQARRGKYTVADMEQLALGAGFSPENARTMAAIGMAESGGRATIDTVQSGLDPGRTNEFSVGLFQVNAPAHGDKLRKLGYTADDLRDPKKAAQVAKMVYDEVGNFKPWSVYKSGAYSQYLQQ